MNILTRIGCFIVGWEPKILENCKEISYATLKKYMAAIIILSIIWGVIGWYFADNYLAINTLYGKILTSIVFIVVIVCVERYIILSFGKLTMIKIFRTFLAVLMAILGSTIFDQIVFKNDINFQMKEIRTGQINTEIPKRTVEIDNQINEISRIIDTLNKINLVFYEEIANKPTISVSEVSNTRRQVGKDDDGKPIYENDRTITQKAVPNPKAEQASQNEKLLSEYRLRQEALQDRKLNISNEVRQEYEMANVGFLEELNALYSLLAKNGFMLSFYIFLFLFLMSLELLVITTKGKNSCDYEMLLDFQLESKKKELKL